MTHDPITAMLQQLADHHDELTQLSELITGIGDTLREHQAALEKLAQVREGHRLWPHIQGWAAELGLTGLDAVAAASQSPGDLNREREPDGGRLGREAAD